MEFRGLTLDTFQEDAVKAIDNNHSVVVSAPTGSGKTLTADYLIEEKLKQGKHIVYTAPIKALSNQKYKDFSEYFGKENVGLLTGDIVINPTAPVRIMTTEIYRNMVMTMDKDIDHVAYVVFDEVHYINDIERGYVWEESIIYSPKNIRFLCLSATIPNAKQFADWIQAIKGHTVETIYHTTRAVPLKHRVYDEEYGILKLKSLHNKIKDKKNLKNQRVKPDHVNLIRELYPEKCPLLFFSFSRRDCQNKAQQLARAKVLPIDHELNKEMLHLTSKWPSDVHRLRSSKTLKESLKRGIGFHHAGLLPAAKELVETLFNQGKIKVLYTTETFAVGINMPAKTVVFNSLRKYDGQQFRQLNTKEYFQIAGRAGRRGIDTEGLVVSIINRSRFNYKGLSILFDKDIEPIKSQFKLCINTVLNLVHNHTEQDIEMILKQSFHSYQEFGDSYDSLPYEELRRRYKNLCRLLTKLGFIEDGQLTHKGEFARHIFVDEISLTEIFATGLYTEFNEYQLLLTLGSLVYEPRDTTRFKQIFRDEVKPLQKRLMDIDALRKDKKFKNLLEVTALTYPLYHDGFFGVLKNTNLLEGDVIRFYGQILDRLGQLKKASVSQELKHTVNNLTNFIMEKLEGIYDFD